MVLGPGSGLTVFLGVGVGFGSGSGSSSGDELADLWLVGSAMGSSARLLVADSTATSLLELLQTEPAGSESSILWLRSDRESSVSAVVLRTWADTEVMQGAGAGAGTWTTADNGSGVLGVGVGGGAGALRFFI